MYPLARSLPFAPVLAMLLVTGCATEPTPAKPVLPQSAPQLVVVIDCGDCSVPSAVTDSIRSSYAAAAAKAGVPLVAERRATLTIKDYRERSLAIRALSLVAGPLAFALKDEIRAVASVEGRPAQELEYHYRLPIRGIDAVASKMGELSFAAVLQ